jgi:uncharacterized protein (TIGR00297 family)
VNSAVRRAGAFAVVGSLALAVPLLEEAAAAPFAAIAVLAAFSLDDGPVFELFARPGERRDRRLYGLIGFALSASVLALLAATSAMPASVGVGAILLVGYGNLSAQAVRGRFSGPAVGAAAYVLGGGAAAFLGQAAARRFDGQAVLAVAPELVFLAATGAVLGALLRTLLFESDDPHVMLSTGLWLWLASELVAGPTATTVALALALPVAFGYLSYALDTASVSGMLTGVWIGMVTVVLGGIGWFAVLIAFFGIGGLSTKFRYDRKLERGVAEDNEGARSTANVFANAAVGLVAVLGYAAVDTTWRLGEVVVPAAPVAPGVFVFAFAGSLATAMSDTLSSEIGGAYDDVRLITTLRPVEPGTDGGVTWQGELAGVAGAATVAGAAYLLFDAVGPAGLGVVALAGVVGMTVDSLLGATVEGRLVGNGAVNLAATLTGALVAAAAAVALGIA